MVGEGEHPLSNGLFRQDRGPRGVQRSRPSDMHHTTGRSRVVCRRKPTDAPDCGVALDGQKGVLKQGGRVVEVP